MATWFSGGKQKSRGGTSLGQGSPAPDVKGRLSFSSLATPRPTPQMHRLSGDHPGPSGTSRLGEYHRSKQSPSVLDQFLSPPTTLSRPSHTLYKSSPTLNINLERFNSRSGGTGVLLSPSRRARTPLQAPLLPARLSDQRPSPFGPSLVNLAVRGRLRQSQSAAVSPVVVQLSSPSTSSGSSEVSQRIHNQGENRPDPCDKEVVISALKQKRKRWACPSDDITTAMDSQPAAKRSRHTEQQHSHSLPTTPIFARPSLHSRKRDHTSSSSLSHQSLKKPRVLHLPHSTLHPPPSTLAESSSTKMDTTSHEVMGPEERDSETPTGKSEVELSSRDMEHVTMPETGQPRVSGPGVAPGISRSLKLSVPEVDYESDSESVRFVPAVGGKVDGVEESSVDSGRGSRGSTPPVQEEEEEDGREEDERARKNKADLHRLHKSLTAIFPSLHKSTSRRKVPVFCATGSAPLQPPVLSNTRSVTQEDWRKEREMARARLRDFLAAEDDPPSKTLAVSSVPSSTTTSVSSGTPTTQQGTPPSQTPLLAVSTSTTALPATSVTSSVTSSNTLKLNTSQPTAKSVTFQLPNVATSTQLASSVTATTSQSDPIQSGAGTRMGLVSDAGIKLALQSTTAASTVAAIGQFSTTSTPSLSVPFTTLSSTTTGLLLTGGGVSLLTPGLKLPPPSTAAPLPTATPLQLPLSQAQQETKPASQPPPQPLSTLFPINTSLGSTLQTPPTTTSITANPPQLATVTSTTSIMSSSLSLQPSLNQPALNTPFQQSLTANNQPMMFAPFGSGPQLQLTNTTTTAQGSTPGGFSFGGGLNFPSLTTTTSTSSSAASGLVAPPLTTPISQASGLQQSLMAGPLQKLSTGGLFKLEQTPKLTQSVPSTTSSGGLNFNFGGESSGFKFSSGGPTPQLKQPSQQKSLPLFGGGPQHTGGVSLGGSGGIFGTTTTTTSAPAFNFSTSTTSSVPQPIKFSGGIFSNSGPQTNDPSKPPSFNFGSLSTPSTAFNFSAAPQQQSQQAAVNTLPFSGGVGGAMGGATSGKFNFSGTTSGGVGGAMGGATGGKFNFSGTTSGGVGGAVGGAMGGATSGKFNFSGTTSEAGGSAGLGSSSTDFQFGAAPTTQGGGVGFNFSTGSNSTGGLNFGTNMTPSSQMAGAAGNAVFGGSTNQMQVGGIFGQSTPQQNSSSTGGLFNPSLTAPATSLTPQPKPQGFNFTPQPTANAFNFSAGAAGGFGTPGGVFGTPGVGSGLFSAGTPSDTSRPVATARRRRGRRK